MNRVPRLSLALIGAVSLTVGMAGAAHAQSSGSADMPVGANSIFSGLSSGSSPTNEPADEGPTPSESRLISSASQAAADAGFNLSSLARQQAELYLPRAMQGEYTFIRDTAHIDAAIGTAFVHRVAPAQIHLLEAWLWVRDSGDLADPGYESSYNYGVAAGTDDNYIYLVEYSYYAPQG